MKKLLSVCLIAVMLAVICCAAMAAKKGTLTIAGSNTMLPLSQLWAEEFMQKYPQASVSVSGAGSGTGISGLINGMNEIANASRKIKAKEVDAARSRNQKVVETKVAKDGLAIIVNSSNDLKSLSMDQLGGIYCGKIKTWKQVGGDSSKNIVLVGRDSSSGTYGFFQEAVLGGGAYGKGMLNQPSSAAVAQTVAQSKDAIGYVGIAYADEFAKQGKVRIVGVSAGKGSPVMPSDESVKNGKYPLWRYLYCYTIGKPKGLAADFLKFALSAEGQSLVKKADYVPLN